MTRRHRRSGSTAPHRAVVVLLLALASGCATSRVVTDLGVPQPGRRVVAQARTFTGTAYRTGGATPQGFDCSGFVQYLYGQLGVSLPRTASDQFDVGRDVDERRLTAGDLVFFRTDGRRVSHVGIAVGDGTFIHAPNTRSRIRVDRLDDRYWSDHYAGARRLVE